MKLSDLLEVFKLAKREPTEVQTLIFSKESFDSAEKAKAWAKEHDYSTPKVDETEDSYRIRQRDPEEFNVKSFRTIALTKGVAAVIGHLKKAEMASGGDGDLEEEKWVEVARSGRFYPLNTKGKPVEITKAMLQEMVETFDLSEHRPKCKIGHPPQEATDTPAYGSITGLQYDEKKDRLLAKVKPTEELRKAVREGAYTERSMEFHPKGPGGKARFLHLSWLGASDPAISGLAPVTFSIDPGAVVVLALGPEAEKDPLDKNHITEGERPTDQKKEIEEKKMSEKELEDVKAKLARAQARLKSGAEARVDAFLAAHVKRFPLTLVKGGLREILVHFAVKEASEDGGVVKMSLPGEETETERSEYGILSTLLAKLPEQLTGAETKETVTEGKEDGGGEPTYDLNPLLGASVDPESVKVYDAALEEIAKEKGKGNVLTFEDASRRVITKMAAKGELGW